MRNAAKQDDDRWFDPIIGLVLSLISIAGAGGIDIGCGLAAGLFAAAYRRVEQECD